MRKALYIFGLLNDADVELLATLGRVRTVPAGAVLIAQGRQLDRLYILLDGHMDVAVAGVGTVATLGSGEVLGEMSFVDSAPTSATVRALDDVRLLDLPRAELEERFVADPAFGMRFFKAIAVFLAERMRSTVQRLGYGRDAARGTDDGDPAAGLATPELLEDELDDGLLGSVGIAGERFARLVRLLADRGEA